MDWLSPREGPALLERLDELLPNRDLIKWRDAVQREGQPPRGAPLPPNAGPQAEPAAPFDVEEFLRQQLGKQSRGGGGGGVSFSELIKAGNDDDKRALAIIDRIQSVRNAQGALEAGRPLTQTFDSLAADKRLRSANPESRPDNTDYWRGQNLPKWVGGEAGFAPHGDPAAAARLMFDVDKRAETSYETKLAKLLGMEKEGVANQNLTAKEEHARSLASLLPQMPTEMEERLSRDMSKTGLAKAKIAAQLQQAATRGARDTKNEEQLKMAADLLRSGAIKQSDFLDLKKKLAGFGAAPGMKMSELKDLTTMSEGNPVLMRVFADYQSGAFGPLNDPRTNQRLAAAVTAAQAKK